MKRRRGQRMGVGMLAVAVVVGTAVVVYVAHARQRPEQAFRAFCAALRAGDYAGAQSFVGPGILRRDDNQWVVKNEKGSVFAATEFAGSEVEHVWHAHRLTDMSAGTLLFSCNNARGNQAYFADGRFTGFKAFF